MVHDGFMKTCLHIPRLWPAVCRHGFMKTVVITFSWVHVYTPRGKLCALRCVGMPSWKHGSRWIHEDMFAHPASMNSGVQAWLHENGGDHICMRSCLHISRPLCALRCVGMPSWKHGSRWSHEIIFPVSGEFCSTHHRWLFRSMFVRSVVIRF